MLVTAWSTLVWRKNFSLGCMLFLFRFYILSLALTGALYVAIFYKSTGL